MSTQEPEPTQTPPGPPESASVAPGTTPEPNLVPDAPKRPARLSSRLAARGAAQMEEYLLVGDGMNPSMVAQLWAMFNDDRVLVDEKYDDETGVLVSKRERLRVSIKERTGIANLFFRQALSRERMMRSLGMKYDESKPVESMLQRIEASMTPEEKRQFLLDALHGEKA